MSSRGAKRRRDRIVVGYERNAKKLNLRIRLDKIIYVIVVLSSSEILKDEIFRTYILQVQ